MARSTIDTIIVGAGVAGLVAAAKLGRSGQRVLLLEARDRIGGRCWSLHDRELSVPLELGAEFIHGHAKTTFEHLSEAGLTAIDAIGSHWFLQHGKLHQHQRFFDEIKQGLREEHGRLNKDVSFHTLLQRDLRHRLSPEAQTFARRLVEGFDAADPARASAQAIIEEWSNDATADAEQFRPRDGYGALCAALAAPLAGNGVRLQLQTPLRAVKWRRGRVEVLGEFLGRQFRAVARRAIITLPLGVLQMPPRSPGAVDFDPPLKEKRHALRLLASGAALKVVLRFHSAFWEEQDRGRYREAAFFHVARTVFPTFWTALPARAPVLIAWTGGPAALRLSKLSSSEIARHAVTGVKHLFGNNAVEGQLRAAVLHNWQRDPFSRGAYSYIAVGGKSARKELGVPLQNTLFFAGEATDIDGEAATVAGALRSGARVAQEVLNHS